MKKYLYLFFAMIAFWGCEKKEVSEPARLISQNPWVLERFTSVDGNTISQASLNSDAKYVFEFQYEFKIKDSQVWSRDKESKAILVRGTWQFINDNTAVHVEIPGLTYDFEVVKLATGQLILQAPTGNFLSKVGDKINLEFKSVNQ